MTTAPIRSSAPPQPDSQTGLRALQAIVKQRSPLGALRVFHRELGNVFQSNLPGFKPIMLVGPQAAEFVLVTDRDKFLWRSEGEPVTNLLRRGVLVTDGAEHDSLRKLMNPAMHRQLVNSYVDTMRRAVDDVIDTWQPGQTQDMLVEMRKVALLVLMRTLFGVNFSADMPRLWPAIIKTLGYISPGVWLIWRGAPRPGYKKALRQMDDYLYHIIRERRANIGPTTDLLGLLVSTPGMSDDLIRDQLLTMLIAGHDTSTAQLSWSLYLLGSNPDALQQAQAETHSVLGDTPPSLEVLGQLPYLEQVIKETLRLYPPIHLSMRVTASDIEFAGYRLPAGARVLFSIYLTHRHPDYWPHPDKFDPARFSAEQNRARPHYVYLPFGGGPRNCIGFAFAQVEAKVVLARILQRVGLQLLPQRVHEHMGATLEPRPGVLMRIDPRRD
jgi:cytochrome P450